MKIVYIISCLLIVVSASWWVSAMPVKIKTCAAVDDSIIKLSEKLLYAVKTGAPTTSIENELLQLPPAALFNGLCNDTAKKTFWINIYNAFYQLLAIRERKTKPSIFTGKYIVIANHSLSLDDIEHGLLRKYRWKYSLGYLPQFFPSGWIKKRAVTNIDYRIHFALNCGARSCPPISFYTYNDLEEQLLLAEKSFIKSETQLDTVTKKITTSKIFKWFKADFSGNKGIKKIIAAVFQQNLSDYSLSFNAYNWSSQLNNFRP